MTPPFGNDNMTDTKTEGISAALLHVVDAETKVIGEQMSSSMTARRLPQQPNGSGGVDVATMAARRVSEGQGGGVNADVGELVVKAKKAAASLWMILHAQVRDSASATEHYMIQLQLYLISFAYFLLPTYHLSNRQNCHSENCPYPQCTETQTLLEHVQSCPVSTNPTSPCPTSCKGCNETRKLLAHYHKCKEIRSNQSNTQSKHPQQSSCLVCSLMARYAKNVTIKQQAAMPPTKPKQRPRSESYPELKSPERKSRQVKFAPCLRTTRYYHPEKDKSYCVARRPRSFSLGSTVSSETIEEEGTDRECTEEIALTESL